MLPSFRIPDRPPSPSAHRRLRLAVGLLLGAALALLVLQATPHALLPAAKTSTLWGFLVGLALMSAFAEVRWSRAAHRDRAG